MGKTYRDSKKPNKDWEEKRRDKKRKHSMKPYIRTKND